MNLKKHRGPGVLVDRYSYKLPRVFFIVKLQAESDNNNLKQQPNCTSTNVCNNKHTQLKFFTKPYPKTTNLYINNFLLKLTVKQQTYTATKPNPTPPTTTFTTTNLYHNKTEIATFL